MAYIYAAELWCDTCGEAIVERLRAGETQAQGHCTACRYRGPRSEFAARGTLNAECWLPCPSCKREASAAVDAYSYDSDDFPKACDSEQSDTPTHCAGGETCAEAETLVDGSRVGAIIDSGLTLDGECYVAEAIADYFDGGTGSRAVLQLWAESYVVAWPPTEAADLARDFRAAASTDLDGETLAAWAHAIAVELSTREAFPGEPGPPDAWGYDGLDDNAYTVDDAAAYCVEDYSTPGLIRFGNSLARLATWRNRAQLAFEGI